METKPAKTISPELEQWSQITKGVERVEYGNCSVM